jgi:hypothetical protein
VYKRLILCVHELVNTLIFSYSVNALNVKTKLDVLELYGVFGPRKTCYGKCLFDESGGS